MCCRGSPPQLHPLSHHKDITFHLQASTMSYNTANKITRPGKGKKLDSGSGEEDQLQQPQASRAILSVKSPNGTLMTDPENKLKMLQIFM